MPKQYTKAELDRMFNGVLEDVSTFSAVGAILPDMGNWTIEKMVDMAGDAGQVEALAKGLKEMCRDIIKVRRQGSASFTGDNYVLNIREQKQSRMTNDSAEAVIRMLCQRLEMSEPEIQATLLEARTTIPMEVFSYARINAG